MLNLEISRPILDPHKMFGRCSHTTYTIRKFLPPKVLLICLIPGRQAVVEVDIAGSYVSVMHGNGVRERTCLILEGKGRRELSCSLLHLKMLPSHTQYWHLRTPPLYQNCIHTYFMNYCCKYWRKMSFILFFCFLVCLLPSKSWQGARLSFHDKS
jgi:hypothetical protein